MIEIEEELPTSMFFFCKHYFVAYVDGSNWYRTFVFIVWNEHSEAEDGSVGWTVLEWNMQQVLETHLGSLIFPLKIYHLEK